MDNRLIHAKNPEIKQFPGIDDRRRCREKRCLCCCLSIEILLIILSYLPFGDYVSFRSVCKSWQSAFVEYSPLITQRSNRRQLPWFIVLKHGPNLKEEQLLKTTGKVGDLSTKRIYNTGIPELCGSLILSSKHGWLLLFSSEKQSLFFLNPFSRATIDIPFLDDVTQLTSPVFDTSAPPTSPDCIVFVVSCDKDKEESMKISTCVRGEAVWQTNTFWCGDSPVVNSVFVDGVWYCFRKNGRFLIYDVVTRECNPMVVPGVQQSPVSHVSKRGKRVYMCCYGEEFHEVLLNKKRLKTPRSSFTNRVWHILYDKFIRSSPERAFMETEIYDLKVDTFNTRAWCIDDTKKNGDIKFRWHGFRSEVDDWDRPKLNKCCYPKNGVNNDCSTFIMWIEPVWVHPSTNLSWI